MTESSDVPERTVELLVNGMRATVACDAGDSLLHVLRNRLGLRGSRFGCGQEACGACMVLVDGVARHSCTLAAADAAGRAVVTVEGLAAPGELSPLQQAFLDEQAGQCGYCLPGILIVATAFLRGNPAPAREQVAAALDGNLCRCGAHNRIIRAVLKAAAA